MYLIASGAGVCSPTPFWDWTWLPRAVALFGACSRSQPSGKREMSMSENQRERWRELAEMAIVESDPQRVTELFRQIDQLLSDSENRPGPDALQTDAA